MTESTTERPYGAYGSGDTFDGVSGHGPVEEGIGGGDMSHDRARNPQDGARQPTEEARAAAYALPSYDDGYCSPDVFGTGTGVAAPLDDYDFGCDYR